MAFVLTKLLWKLIDPVAVLLAMLLVGMVLSRKRFARWLATAATLVLLAVAVLPVGPWLLSPLEQRFPHSENFPPVVAGIIVLGGGVEPGTTAHHGLPSLNADAERLTTGVMLARRYPSAKVVFAGGDGKLTPTGSVTEADVAWQIFEQVGFDTSRVIFEDKSRNTRENALFSLPLVQPKAGERWLLVTSAYHMPRAVAVFRAAGWPVEAWPVAYRLDSDNEAFLLSGLWQTRLAIHEWVGLLAYRALGWTSEVFPKP